MERYETKKTHWNMGMPTKPVEAKPVIETLTVDAITLALRGADIWGTSMAFLTSMRPELALKAFNDLVQRVYSGEKITKVTEEEVNAILQQD